MRLMTTSKGIRRDSVPQVPQTILPHCPERPVEGAELHPSSDAGVRLRGAGVREAVGVGSCLDDVSAEGEPVDDTAHNLGSVKV